MVNMINAMLYLRFMQEQAEQRAATGRVCYAECTSGGLRKKGFNVEMIDFLDGDEAGYKSVTLQIDGENAYGYLKSEHGVHRLVRISPFNASRKKTDFFLYHVM